MYTLTQIEREIDPGRTCTDRTSSEDNGGKLNRKNQSYFSSEYDQF